MMVTKPPMQEFADLDALAAAVAMETARLLRQAVVERGRAVLGVTGGRTPEAYLPLLARDFADWDKVTVVLVDDRWVPPTSPDSNEGLARRCLPQARILSLVHGHSTLAEDAVAASRHLAQLPEPWDVALLGMGEDGHIASLFPKTGAVCDPALYCLAVPQAPRHPRISLSAAALHRFQRCLLAITGMEKRVILERAYGEGDPDQLPARLLFLIRNDIKVFWSP